MCFNAEKKTTSWKGGNTTTLYIVGQTDQLKLQAIASSLKSYIPVGLKNIL